LFKIVQKAFVSGVDLNLEKLPGSPTLVGTGAAPIFLPEPPST
jgi:hypothetical protein